MRVTYLSQCKSNSHRKKQACDSMSRTYAAYLFRDFLFDFERLYFLSVHAVSAFRFTLPPLCLTERSNEQQAPCSAAVSDCNLAIFFTISSANVILVCCDIRVFVERETESRVAPIEKKLQCSPVRIKRGMQL